MLTRFLSIGAFFVVLLLSGTGNAAEKPVSIGVERLHAILNEALSGGKIDAEPGLYQIDVPLNLADADVVVRYLQVSKDGVFLVADNLPTKTMFIVAPIKVDVSAISKARNISELIAAFKSPPKSLTIEKFVPTFADSVAQSQVELVRMPYEIVGHVASIIGDQLVTVTYDGIITPGTKPIASRPLVLMSITARYVSDITLWPSDSRR